MIHLLFATTHSLDNLHFLPLQTTLGEKLKFSIMVSTMFQLHFEVENVISNYICFLFST
jgi:hypothetical protein